MADIRPFCAVRPRRGMESRIAALPYDVYSREEARAVVQGDTDSFLRIDRPETQFAEGYDMYAPEVYEKAASMLQDMIMDGRFVREEQPIYYIYEQEMQGRRQTGIAAVSSVDDYLSGTIKKHENTREEKELDRIRHVDTCNAQTGPIFLAYRANEVIKAEIARAKEQPALYDFVSSDGVGHRVWTINDSTAIERIRQAFQATKEIYIADGHHRCASAVKVCLKRREQDPDYTGEEEYNFFLSVLFADRQLFIMDYNRVVKDLNGYTEEQFLQLLGESFTITQESGRPQKKGTYAMYLNQTWYRLEYTGQLTLDPVMDLDVSVLQDKVLGPILGIRDPKTDKRIDFVGGIRGLAELERRVHTDSAVAFALFPTSIQELFDVADAGRLMPPKSTWFEPKLRSGLLIHQI